MLYKSIGQWDGNIIVSFDGSRNGAGVTIGDWINAVSSILDANNDAEHAKSFWQKSKDGISTINGNLENKQKQVSMLYDVLHIMCGNISLI